MGNGFSLLGFVIRSIISSKNIVIKRLTKRLSNLFIENEISLINLKSFLEIEHLQKFRQKEIM